ncbi:unnamed protein product [Timema podura]|uniref:Exonuclease domain-containing protein n=1 Tax=Timema podura TaxID=61482 RepID=A0ABN7NUC3_TIMPD|nr:unnamed protein product [Timema podura]
MFGGSDHFCVEDYERDLKSELLKMFKKLPWLLTSFITQDKLYLFFFLHLPIYFASLSSGCKTLSVVLFPWLSLSHEEIAASAHWVAITVECIQPVVYCLYTEYVFTKSEYKEVTPNSPMFALDCEMCRTTTGELELTRASLVNEKLEVMYDILVKPDNNITDYLTRYSGITEKMLSEVTNKLSDVQKDLINLLPPDAILVGHSLNCDLHALQMMHPYVIDTSVIYNMTGDRSRKCKLALLCDRLLHESIQKSSKGHSPIEDSQAAMKLAQMKLANTVEFGDAVLMGRTKAEKTLIRTLEKEQAANIFNQAPKEKTAIVIASESVIREYKLHLGSKEPASTCNVKCVVADSNSDVVTQTCQVALEHHMTISHIRVDCVWDFAP